MESWRLVWRDGFVPVLSTAGLESLRDALREAGTEPLDGPRAEVLLEPGDRARIFDEHALDLELATELRVRLPVALHLHVLSLEHVPDRAHDRDLGAPEAQLPDREPPIVRAELA